MGRRSRSTPCGGAVITEAGLAKLFHRHQVSIQRAVKRGELFIPTKLLGKPIWTAASIIDHITRRLQDAAKEKRDLEKKIQSLRP